MIRPLEHLEYVIRLSEICVKLCEKEDWMKAIEVMQARDKAYTELDLYSASVFNDWAFNRLTVADMTQNV